MIFILDNKNIKSNENRIEGNESCSFDKILKSEEVHNEEKEIWKNMYLKAAYKLEQLENQKSKK